MNNIEYKKEISYRMLSRAATGLYFLEDFLYRHSAKDGAYFRSLCILLSHNFELVLKALVVLTSMSTTKDQLDKELRLLNHNIIEISKKLGSHELNNIGIKDITLRDTTDFTGYIIQTNEDKEILIEGFNDIRYDFMNDSLRNLPENEDFKMWVIETLIVLKKVKQIIAEVASE